MTFVVADRVREFNVITGTGNVTLGGSLSGFRTFASVMTNGQTTWYSLVDNGAGAWEVGIGTWNTGNTLTRTTVLASSNSGSLVTFAGNVCDCFITFPAELCSGATTFPALSTGTFTASGQVTINGTTTTIFDANSAAPATLPTGTLIQLVGTTSTNIGILIDAVGTNPVPYIYGRHAGGTVASPTATAQNRTLLTIGGLGYANSAYTTSPSAFITFVAGHAWTSTDNSSYMEFYVTQAATTTTINPMTIWNTGDVLVGTGNGGDIAGGGALQVVGGTQTDTLIVNTQYNTGNAFPALPTNTVAGIVGGTPGTAVNVTIDAFAANGTIYGRRAQGTLSSPTTVTAATQLLGVGVLGYNGSAYTTTPAAGIVFQTFNQWTTGDNSTQILFNVTASGSTTETTVMQLQNSGILTIGTTSVSGSNKLQVTGGTATDTLNVTTSLTSLPFPASSTLSISSGNLINTDQNVQTFSTSGTWTKPSWVTANTVVEVYVVGGGGGGGGGAQEALGTVGTGGGAGGGGAALIVVYPASSLGATETITIAGGGTSGAGGTLGSNGGIGGQGGNTSFGSHVVAYGGGGGGPGQTAAASGGGASGGVSAAGNNASGGTPGGGQAAAGSQAGYNGTSVPSVFLTHNVPGAGTTTSVAQQAAGADWIGGSAGGGVLLSGSAGNGGTGGASFGTGTATGGASATTGTAGAGGNAVGNGGLFPTSSGAAGGGANSGGTGGAGGTKASSGNATYGSGGGGGGAGTTAGGAGGNGCPGYCVVVTYGS